MCVRDTNEVHISVQAAEYGEIAGKRIDIMAFAVVNQNSQAVRTAGRAEICDVETKSGISTTMLAQKFVVQICAAHGVGGLKFQIESPVGLRRHMERTIISAAGSPIIFAALTIFGIPGVRETNCLCFFRGKQKRWFKICGRYVKKPVIIEGNHSTHFYSSLYIKSLG